MLQIGKKAWVFDLAQTLLRSWWTLVAAASLGLAGATFALQRSPELYEASTKVWMSEPELDSDIQETPVKEDLTKRLMTFSEADLGQSYMIQLIEETFGLPETDEELRGLMALLRSRMSVSVWTQRRAGITNFSLTYRGDTNPERTANVVNTLTNLYILQNEEFRADRAEKTADTIFSLAEAVKPELDEIERKLIEFKRVHPFETLADLPENQKLMDSAQRELELMKTTQASLEARRQSLEAQLRTEKMRVSNSRVDPSSPDLAVDPLAVRIATLQSELDEMRIHYSELHPSYIKKKREIEELLREARTREPEASVDSGESFDPAVAALQVQINAAEREAQILDERRTKLRRDIAEYRRRIAVQPEVQQEFERLSERHEHLRDRYQRLLLQAENAKGSVNLEENRLVGRRMEVLAYASVPTIPYAPQPKNYYGVGLALGCLLFVGPLLARSLVSPLVLSEEGFRALSDIPVLASIPNLHGSRRVALKRLFKNLALAVLAGAVLVATKLFFVFNV